GRDPSQLRCVEYTQPPTSLSLLLGADAPRLPAASLDLSSLLDLAAPRAYYLCTWLPSILSNRR
ncbi:MAG: hypothetical protein AAF961_17795, partial [Planctomycetota bacterium]